MMPRPLSITINYDRCLKVFLFVAPIIWLPGITQNNLQMLILDYGALMLFGLSIALPPKRQFANYNIFLVLCLYCLVSSINNFKGYPVSLIHLTAGCLLYFSIVRSVEDVKGVIRILLYLSMLNIFVFLCQFIKFDFVYADSNIRIMEHLISNPGLMARNYHLAYFLSFTAPFMFLFGKKGAVLAAISILTVFMSGSYDGPSYACILSLFCGLAVFVLLKFGKQTGLILISILCILGVALNAGNYKTIKIKTEGRQKTTLYLAREAFINPFIGRGIGSLEGDKNLFGENPDFYPAFSEYMRITNEAGVLPFILICIGILRYFRSIGVNSPAFLSSFLSCNVMDNLSLSFKFLGQI